MLQVRITSSLGYPLMQVQHHVTCCSNGACQKPQVVCYVHPTRYTDDIPTVAGVLAEMFHGYVSEAPEALLRESLAYHPAGAGAAR